MMTLRACNRYYSPFIFERAGFDGMHAQFGMTALMGIVKSFFILVAVCLLDAPCSGRRPLLSGSLLGIAISLAALAAAFVTARFRAHLTSVALSRPPSLATALVLMCCCCRLTVANARREARPFLLKVGSSIGPAWQPH